MNELVAFLLTRYDEDEAAARAALNGPSYDYHDGTAYDEVIDMGLHEGASDAAEAHFERHEPERVLVDITALRSVVALHADGNADTRWDGDADPLPAYCTTCEDRTRHDAAPWPCPTLKALAAAYATHPDYRDDWKL